MWQDQCRPFKTPRFGTVTQRCTDAIENVILEVGTSVKIIGPITPRFPDEYMIEYDGEEGCMFGSEFEFDDI